MSETAEKKKQLQVGLGVLNKLVIGVTPIYPVRYAYVNFFEEQLSAPSPPPKISTLLQGNIHQSHGYVVRLLREGWVYIREEDNPQKGNFHIFKYQKEETSDGNVEERFYKYLFKNGINAKDGIIPDNSGAKGKLGYPFVFVSDQKALIRIVYSEHEWSADVIDKIHGDEEIRKKTMQMVDLRKETDTDSIINTDENLKNLIEDYKERQDRFFESKSNQSPNTSLDVLTTELSYNLKTEDVAEALQRSIYTGRGRIIALHDPLGRQKEIAFAHAQLALWEKAEATENVYPYTIGRFVKDMQASTDEDIQDMLKENINLGEHKKYWEEMDSRFGQFKTRQKEFAELYKAFMMDPGVTGQPGSLDSYFKYFFASDSLTKQEDLENEIQKIGQTCVGLFDGILSTTPGNIVMEQIINDAADNFENQDTSDNVFNILIMNLLIRIITQPQGRVDWTPITIKFLDYIMLHIAPILGKIASAATEATRVGYEVTKRGFYVLKLGAIIQLAENIIPKILEKGFGVYVDDNNRVKLTADELGKLVARMIDASQGSTKQAKQAMDAIEEAADLNLKRGKNLFNWIERVKKAELPKLYTLSKVDVNPANYNRYQFAHEAGKIQKVALLFDTGFAGLSAYFNVKAIYDLQGQNEYSLANPISQGSHLQNIVSLTSTITALTVDTLVIAYSTTAFTGKVLEKAATPAALKALAPALKARAANLGGLVNGAGTFAAKLIVVANLAGAIASIWSGFNSLHAGNTGEATGHFMVAGGSVVLFVQGLIAMGSGTAAAGAGLAPTGIGLGVALFGLALIGIGAVLLYIYGKSDFEKLLQNCFWGSGGKYAIWLRESVRPNIQDRLADARLIRQDAEMQTYYAVELQEFSNYLNMPQLKIEKDVPFAASIRDLPRTYDYTFTLPNFVPGVSEIYYGIYTPSDLQENGQMTMSLNQELTDKLAEQIANSKITPANGAAIINARLEIKALARIIWAYEPSPGTLTPLRYIRNGDIYTQPLIGMLDENPR